MHVSEINGYLLGNHYTDDETGTNAVKVPIEAN